MESSCPADLFFSPSSLPSLIKSVIDHAPGSQLDLIEALPILIHHLPSVAIRNELIPFILGYVDFSDRLESVRLASNLHLFLPPYTDEAVFESVLFPINELVRQSPFFVQDLMLEFCDKVTSTLDASIIEGIFLPSLDQLFSPGNFDAQGVAIQMQAKLLKFCSPKWAAKINERALSLAENQTSFIRISLLKSLDSLCKCTDDPKPLIRKILIPSFTHPDFKVVSHSINALTGSIRAYVQCDPPKDILFSLAASPSWCVRMAFAQHFDRIIENVPSPADFFPSILRLCSDPVNEVRLIAYQSMTKSIKFFNTSDIVQIDKVVEEGIKSQNEEIRNEAIKIWSAIAVFHKDSPFLPKLNRYLSLISSVPIESLVFSILFNVVPNLGSDDISPQVVLKGLSMFFDSLDYPLTLLNGIQIINAFISSEWLNSIVLSHFELWKPLFWNPSLAVRREIGHFAISVIVKYGWNPIYDMVKPIIIDILKGNNILYKVTACQTITELTFVKGSEKYIGELIGMITKVGSSYKAAEDAVTVDLKIMKMGFEMR